MKSILRLLNAREISRQSCPIPCTDTGLRQYQLHEILPRCALEDIFLGFSVCGQFLVSYKYDFKRFFLRFWLFPPARLAPPDRFSLKLFSEAALPRLTYTSRFNHTPSVRFIQSVLQPSSFLIVSCDYDGNGLLAAFGSMPDVECTDCIDICAELQQRSGLSYGSRTCSTHLQLLSLNLDLPTVNKSVFDEESARYGLGISFPNRRSAVTTVVPPCLRPDPVQSIINGKVDEVIVEDCGCFASTNAPIGLIHVSVCSRTGSIRMAWPSPDGQIKVISCSFEQPLLPQTSDQPLYIFPQGTSDASGLVPFAFSSSLLTHNYCSVCYSWPASKFHPCTPVTNTGHKVIKPYNCLFHQHPSLIHSVQDPHSWPDNHRPSGQHSPESNAHVSNCPNRSPNGSRTKLQYPAFFADRPSFGCCFPPLYLAMLQDIRASYIHWTLISRITPPRQQALADRTDLHALQSPVEPDSADEAFPPGSQSSSDNEDIALAASPESVDSDQSPEDLLVHRLSGQCHTSFDIHSWEQVTDPAWSASGRPSPDRFSGRLVAHLEETVFDMPGELLDPSQSNSPPLAIFFPPDNQDLLLVYRYERTKATHPSSFSLVDIIDLVSGERVLLSTHDQSRPTPSISDLIQSGHLERLVSRCPQSNPHPGVRRKLIHELNNYHMFVRLESLKLMVDPQGGYAVYW
ncbi:hypothetical protein CSKR_201172 [Clonorchis sinensis]|uniref:DDB1- and CUL4-associated factor 15 WD40 repeat-containing domain-containing protein n=2 Tax=Clonorchis sinensis TaxID=79923 RepID=A0A8T1MLP0_CLOSI|nr:hypothetical protein CSKR_201172 [Clonorchis sinensis]